MRRHLTNTGVRRRLTLGIAAAGAAGALVGLDAAAQPAGRGYRIGILRPTAEPPTPDPMTSSLLPEALARLGYVVGRNLVIDTRYAGGDPGRLKALAEDLASMRVDAIIAVTASAVVAAKSATATIPIVLWGNFDPVALGFVASLGRPGGNVTGVLIAAEGTLAAKKLELLRDVAPKSRRIGVLAPEDVNVTNVQLPELRRAADSLRLQLTVESVRGRDYGDALARLVSAGADALFVLATTYFVTDRRPIIELAIRHRLPSMWEWREQVVDGGLMAYGSSLAERNGRIAAAIDRILRGANPGDLPIDQPTQFAFSINAVTARAIGLALPQALLLRADEVIGLPAPEPRIHR